MVIGLRDDEVSEIKRTGNLTTTKMFDNAEIIKQLNMKVAGTIAEKPKEPQKESLMKEGLTSKQKKNLKKKMQKKRKKLENSQIVS